MMEPALKELITPQAILVSVLAVACLTLLIETVWGLIKTFRR
jgi:hypothetical protein